MHWTQGELGYLGSNWETVSAQEMTKKPLQNHSAVAIRLRASILGLGKSEKGLSEILKRASGRRKDIKFSDKPKELGYIIGVLFSDGHLSKTRFRLGVIDKDFAEEVVNSLNAVFPGIDAKIEYTNQIYTGSTVYHCDPSSVTVADYLKERYTIEWCLKQSSEVKAQILRGLWDGDGCISLQNNRGQIYPVVYFYSTTSKIAILYQKLIEEVLRVKLRIRGPYGEGKMHVVSKGGFDFAKLFYETVSPTIERKCIRFRQAISEAG